jgi:hypothetical protein
MEVIVTPREIFLINIVFALIVWGVVAWEYIWPALRLRSHADALRPILYLHSFRFVGLSFLIPGVVSADLPAAFARPAAYGDLVTAFLALVAVPMLRSSAGIFVVWIFNIVGFVDLLNAFFEGNRTDVGIAPGLQGAAYYIPTVLVPLLLVTHVVCRQNSVRQQIQAINANAGTDPYAINPNS